MVFSNFSDLVDLRFSKCQFSTRKLFFSEETDSGVTYKVSSVSIAKLTLDDDGTYAVTVIVSDNSGNQKLTRTYNSVLVIRGLHLVFCLSVLLSSVFLFVCLSIFLFNLMCVCVSVCISFDMCVRLVSFCMPVCYKSVRHFSYYHHSQVFLSSHKHRRAPRLSPKLLALQLL